MVISKNKVEMDLVKVSRVCEWPVSKFQSNVQAFFGFVNFYYYFIWGFFAVACSLFNFTRLSSTWTWKNKQQEFFDILKKAVTFIPMLVSLDDAKLFCINIDSSDFVTGAVLSKQLEIAGKWHPVAFFSKFLFLVE